MSMPATRFGISFLIRAVCDRFWTRKRGTTEAPAIRALASKRMEAGDWRTYSVFIDTFVHSPTAGSDVDDRFNAYRFTQDF